MRSFGVRTAIGVTLALVIFALNRSGAYDAALSGVAALGPWAAPAFVALHVTAVVAFVPSLVPCLAAGALFGLGGGLPLSLVGTGIGSVLALWIGRTLARDWIERRFAHDSRFEALSRLAKRRGARIVALARLSPLFPFAIGNYAFGLTTIRARDYFIASVVGTIPSSTVFVYLGTLAAGVAGSDAEQGRSAGEWALLLLGLGATVVLAFYLRHLAMTELERS